ncbi:MAG: tetratricopeptide repeat protein [Chthoniobacterales bacterium]
MKKFLLPLLLALATLAAYAPVIRNGFVWDDTALVLRDPLIRSWRLIPEGFQHFLFTDATASDFYRPIQRLTYALEYAAFGFHAAPYHVTSVLCHFLAVLALFFCARELLRSFQVEARVAEIASFIAALVWGIHPALTSAVAYISGRADSLAAAFGFAALLIGIRATRETLKYRWIMYLLCGLLFLLSALSKEGGLIFPAALLAILLIQKKVKCILPASSAIAFAVVIYSVLRFSAEHTPAPAAVHPLPALVRPILMARSVAEYAGLIVCPLHLHMDRDVETHPFGFSSASMTAAAWRELETLAGLLLIAVFIYWMLRARKRDRALFTLLVLTAISYAPVSGLVPLNAMIAEHWLYLPGAFLFAALALTATRFLQSHHLSAPVRGLSIVAFVVWSVSLGVRTFVRIHDWKDQRTFLERTIADGGDSARMLINLGGLELSEGRLDDARKHLESALQKEPDQPLALINLAGVAVKQDDFKSAHDLLSRAAQMPLVEAQAYELMAVLESKETGNANLIRMRLASRTGTPNWSIEKRYVNLLDELGGTDAAIAELRRCLETQWYRADSWKLLSELLAKSGRAEEAAEALAQARRYDVRLDEHS